MSLRFFTRTFLEMNLLDLIGADGGTLKKQATTGGGEYAGACFWCGGNDRFRVWVKSGRYWCRGCGKAGDEIQYLRERRGLSFLEACEYLGYDPGPRKDTARIAAKSWTRRGLYGNRKQDHFLTKLLKPCGQSKVNQCGHGYTLKRGYKTRQLKGLV
jgi:DNA primase